MQNVSRMEMLEGGEKSQVFGREELLLPLAEGMLVLLSRKNLLVSNLFS